MRTFLKIFQAAAILVCLGWCAWLHSRSPKIAYVRSGVIVDKYAGMVEARKAYQTRLDEWQAQLDTLEQQWQHALIRYEKEHNALAASARFNQQKELETRQFAFEKHRASLSEKARLEEEKLLKGTLDQINDYVEKYGREHGFTVVLGTTQSGNLLYAADAVDITDEIVQGLNRAYK